MASTKKDKSAAAPEVDVCANCSAPEGQNDVVLKPCSKCKMTSYCGRACQKSHWKAGHKQVCLAPGERVPQESAAPEAVRPMCEDSGGLSVADDECPVCFDPLSTGALCTLPCTHSFHAACVEGMRKFGVKQVCPMCRVELPPGPEELFGEACKLYSPIINLVKSGRVLWGALTKTQQRDMDKAIELFRGAADQGHVQAQFNLGVMFEEGRGVKQDYAAAMRWCRQAADQGHPSAQFYLGVMYHGTGKGVKQDYAVALRWYRKAADQGDPSAQLILGVMYGHGDGVKQDYVVALRWYRKAADQGNPSAQFNLGVMYDKGKGVKQDYAVAMRWYRQAADQGMVKAQTSIGFIYEKGNGVQQDYAVALRWYRKAADQGDPNAQYNLGVMFDEGSGVKKDYAEALLWYRKAADQGEADAQFKLGNMYYSNRRSVNKNEIEAMRWFQKAAAQGLVEAKNMVAKLYNTATNVASTSRTCEHCGIAEIAGSVALKPCGRCKAVFYCGKDCQTRGWIAGGHREECK